MSGEGITEHRRPLDTSTLGPIRVEPNAVAERARVVREALRSLSVDSTDRSECEALAMVVIWASDEALARLGRMLK
jgi:hypothetical protein